MTQMNDIGSLNALPDILTPKDIMTHLRIGKNRTYQLIQIKSFPKIQIGNSYRIPKDEYLKWLKNNMKQKVYL